jgi:hypothetical protein
MNQKRPSSITGHQEAADNIRQLTQQLLDALRCCDEIKDPVEKAETLKILTHLREDFEGYFAGYVDRRNNPRRESVFDDMLAYYSISGK